MSSMNVDFYRTDSTSCATSDSRSSFAAAASDKAAVDAFLRALEGEKNGADADSADGAISTRERKAASSETDPADIFLRGYKENQNSDDMSQHPGMSHGDEASMFASSMQNPLDSLFAGRMDSVSSTSASAALAEIDMEALVERILVSAPENGAQEVRITLADNVLHGTEVIIQRDALGQLVVSLRTDDASAFQALVAAQHELKARLDDLEPLEVRVNVDMGGEEKNDHDRRSRGLFNQEYQEA